MKIKKIQLKNGYKRFKDLTINLGEKPSKIIALVGPNGCGKSSVFDGMLYLNNAHEAVGQFGQKDFKFHSMDGIANFNYQNIEIVFDSGDFLATRASKQVTGKQNTIFNYRNPYRYNSNLNVTSLQKIPDIKMNNIGASSSIDLDDKMTNNYQRLYIYITDYRKSNDLTDKQAKTQIIGELNEILKKCLGLEISDEGDILSGKGSLYFKKPSQPKEFEFNVLSSGEKEVVDILLDLYLKRKEFDDTIYIIDEPELHLNTGIQKNLLIEIEKIIPDNCQLWVATHSIGFLTALKENLNEKCSVIAFDGDYAAEPKILVPIVKSRNNWQKIFQTALEDLTGLVAPKKIVYCEGKKEADDNGAEAGIDAQVYNQIFEESEPDTFFISSGGNTEPDKYSAVALKVLNKAFKDVELCLLKDKDINADGSSTTDVQRQDFIAANPTMNRMLKRKEIENYLFDYEIISKQYPTVTSEQYNKKISDIQNGDVKNIIGELMALCGISTGINQNGFKLLLSRQIVPATTVYKELLECIFNKTI
jgi:predicted ATPase